MRMYDLIEKKKYGQKLTPEEIKFVVEGYTKGDIPDYQMSAWLMAIYFQGMDQEETAQLTMEMAKSGEMLSLEKISGIKVDKHSTGGVGDTTTLILAPLVAAAGVPVAKMSGRGLGHTGGTIDKLESFSGFQVELPLEKFIDNVNTYGVAVASQTGNLAPADKKIYALRDVTATVDNTSLIAASIMSKKIASGADRIVLDVKCGSGAFMKTLEEATALGEAMVQIGENVGRKTIAVITDMNQPLSSAIGNGLEVIEAIEALKGNGPKELMEVSTVLASHMLKLANKVETLDEGKLLIESLISSGKALDTMRKWIESQGGNPLAVDDYTQLPSAKYTHIVEANEEGYVQGIHTDELGKAALILGAGRENKESIIDLGVGLKVHKRIGDKVKKGDALATLYINQRSKQQEAENFVQQAYTISKEQPTVPPLIYKVIGH